MSETRPSFDPGEKGIDNLPYDQMPKQIKKIEKLQRKEMIADLSHRIYSEIFHDPSVKEYYSPSEVLTPDQKNKIDIIKNRLKLMQAQGELDRLDVNTVINEMRQLFGLPPFSYQKEQRGEDLDFSDQQGIRESLREIYNSDLES